MKSPLIEAYEKGPEHYKTASDCYEYGYINGRNETKKEFIKRLDALIKSPIFDTQDLWEFIEAEKEAQ